jgi:hypothetical protein
LISELNKNENQKYFANENVTGYEKEGLGEEEECNEEGRKGAME